MFRWFLCLFFKIINCLWYAGLASLHANGLCHLDISPENVLLYKGEPVLHDFGMATDYPINSNCKDLMPRVSYVEGLL